MPVPHLRFSMRRLALAAVLLLAGAAAWFFLVRDDGDAPATEAEKPEQIKREPVSDDPIVRRMSVAEQVEQVLMLGFEGSDPGAPGVSELNSREVGAILVRAENWAGLDTGERLVNALAQGDGVPPLIATSQEGGIYRSLDDLPPSERALDIGRDGSPEAARTWASETAEALAGAGFQLNLFPIADVATLDSPLAGRAFSDDPAEVTTLTEAALAGCEESDLACAPLHFPGLGAASQDTAEGPATVSLDLVTLNSRDLTPFEAVRKRARALVLSLALYPDFDAVTPGALSPGVATGLLRDEVGFKGVAISDDLGAGAVTATYSVPDAAVAALGAGIDLIQIGSPEDADGVAKALERAVESGEIEPERLAEAAERVLDLKRELGLVPK
ncbi:MAG: glycoside hydrolase family 3 N-terminal domain-containing protein [Solirubrobacterales bacterium]